MPQSQRMVMVGLGVSHDVPPVAVQPVLRDGIHLRWSTDRGLAFPWGGFYLYRVNSGDLQPTCIAHLFPRAPEAPSDTTRTLSSGVVLSSDLPLTFTDDFAPAGQTELDFAPRAGQSRTLVSVHMSGGDAANLFNVTVGFRPLVTRRVCFDVTRIADRNELRSVLDKQGIQVQVRNRTQDPWTEEYNLQAYPRVPRVGTPGTVTPPQAGNILIAGKQALLTFAKREMPTRVQIAVAREAGEGILTATALDAGGKSLAKASLEGTLEGGFVLTLDADPAGAEIRSITLTQAKAGLIRVGEICREIVVGTPGPQQVCVTAWYGNVPIKSAVLTGNPGDVVSTVLTADSMDSVTVTAVASDGNPLSGLPLPNGALVNCCYLSVNDKAGARWMPLPNLPVTLPLTHPDYPASGSARENPAAARALALARVFYGPSGALNAGFGDLYPEMVALVQGGSARAMEDPTRATATPGQYVPPDPNLPPPQIPALHPLDLIRLASLHPAFSQLIGLYRIDDTAVAGQTYDYLLIADATGASNQSAATALTQWRAGAAGYEGYIVSNLRLGPLTPQNPPQDVEAFALPGGPVAQPGGGATDSTLLAGVRWERPQWNGHLLPDTPVLYHLWREGRGNQAAPLPSTGPGRFLTQDAPILVTEPTRGSNIPQSPPGWPDPLYRTDTPGQAGWFSYRVSGMDLFGRLSPLSAPATVQLLDRLPPPVPAAVEAHLLDDADPLVVKDTAYNTWRSSLPVAYRNTLLGARVRWRWTARQQEQAPDLAEFRLYFSPILYPPGSPPGPPQPVEADLVAATGWQQRVHVVAYDPNHSREADGSQIFEVFLPFPGSPATIFPVPGGVPLVPTVADPIQYAYFGVSAVDSVIGVGDAAKWIGTPYANRDGNESEVGGPSKVYCIYRQRPAPPALPPDSERVFASKADWRSQSFYTYRWFPQPHLKLHLCRALDESVFASDWASRPHAAALTPAAPVFPDVAVEPRWDMLKKQQVCDALNPLNALKTGGTSFADALAVYRALPNDALRVLASLNPSAPAFTQLTTLPLDDSHTNRLGPDNDPATFVVNPTLRCYVDTLDGRATNRYFYRAFFVDTAGNQSVLSLSGPPVYLPDVVAPRAPSLHFVLGSILLPAGSPCIVLTWASNREPDLATYRIYRADDAISARALNSMALQTEIAVAAGVPNTRPAEVSWTDTAVRGLHNYYYRLTAVDTVGNESIPTEAVIGRTFQPMPARPAPATVVWDASHTTVSVTWSLSDPALIARLERRVLDGATWRPVTAWLAPGVTGITDSPPDAMGQYEYRLRVRDQVGQETVSDSVSTP